MACKYTYNGRTYTEAEFKQLVADNKVQLLSRYGNNSIVVIDDIPELENEAANDYTLYPALQQIGTMEEYLEFRKESEHDIIKFAEFVSDTTLANGDSKVEYAKYVADIDKHKLQSSDRVVESTQESKYSSTVKEGVDQVFEQNPELANVAYETLGLSSDRITNEIIAERIEDLTRDIKRFTEAEIRKVTIDDIDFITNAISVMDEGSSTDFDGETTIHDDEGTYAEKIYYKINPNAVTFEGGAYKTRALAEEQKQRYIDNTTKRLETYQLARDIKLLYSSYLNTIPTDETPISGSSEDIDGFREYINSIISFPTGEQSNFPTPLPNITLSDLDKIIDPDFDIQQSLYTSTAVTVKEKDIISGVVNYARESFFAYANRIRREASLKTKSGVEELLAEYDAEGIDLMKADTMSDLIDQGLEIAELQNLIRVFTKDYEFNKMVLLGDSKHKGMLSRLDAYDILDMQVTIHDDIERQNFADFMKKVSIYLKSFNRLNLLESTGIPPAEWSENVKKLNELAELQISLQGAVANAESKYKKLMDKFFEARSLSVTTNPNIINGIMEVFSAQDDESLAQMMLDSLADTNNVFVATTIKNYIKLMGKSKEESNNEINDFRTALMEAFGFTDPKELDRLKPEDFYKYFEKDENGKPTGKLISKYNWEQFFEDRTAMFEAANIFPEHSSERWAILNAWYTKNETKVPLGQVGYKKAIAIKKTQLSDRMFNTWYDKNFKKKDHGNGVIDDVPKVTGDFAHPSDMYLSDQYEAVKDDALYNYLTFLIRRFADYDGKFNILMQGYLPAVNKNERGGRFITSVDEMVDWFNSHKAKHADEFTGENHEVIRLLQFPMSKMLSQLPTIKLDKQGDMEDDQQYEERMIEETREAGLGEFVSLEAIKDHNKEIVAKNKALHAERLNFNMKDVIERFITEATTYKYKKSIETEMLLAIQRTEDLKFVGRKRNKDLSINKAASEHPGLDAKDIEEKSDSNVSRHFKQWIDAIFYENFDIDQGALTAIGKIFLKYVSAKNMWLNWSSGINNVIYGNLMIETERAAGYFASSKDITTGDRLYWSNVTAMFADMHRTTTDNSIVGILRYFDIVETQTEKEIGAKILHKKLMNVNTLYAMQEMGEHQMQNKMLLAMLHSHRIINGKIKSFQDYKQDNREEILAKSISDDQFKKYLEYKADRIEHEKYLDGKHTYVEDYLRRFLTPTEMKKYVETKKATDAELTKEFESEDNMQLIDAFELQNGMSVIKKTSEVPLVSGTELALFRNKVVRVNHKLHGIYNKDDASIIQRTTLGKFLAQFRKWLRPGWNKRFGSKFGKSFWNEGRNEWDEGSYTNTFKFLTTPFRGHEWFKKGEGVKAGEALSNITKDSIEFLKNAKLHWNVLSDFDKAQVKRTMTEMLMLVTMLTIGKVLSKFDWDDEEDKKRTNFMDIVLYQVDRLYSELSFYTPYPGLVNEAQKIVRSPMATYSTMTDIMTLMKHVTSYYFVDDEKRLYTSGPYRDQLKVKVSFVKLVPLWNQWLKYQRLGSSNSYYNLFSHAK